MRTAIMSAILTAAALGSFALGFTGSRPAAIPGAPVVEHSGCCSHHKGVCGCSNKHAECCDGSQSPSCGCD